MSKISNELKVNRISISHVDYQPIPYVRLAERFNRHSKLGVEYHIVCTLESVAILSTYATSDETNNVIKQSKQIIIESIFGEFRPLINDVIAAILKWDKQDVLNKLKTLEREMFDV